MSVNEGVTLNSVRWLEVHPWLTIVRSFRIAVSLRVLVLGALGFLLTLLGWWCIAGMFPKDSPAANAWQRLGGDTSALGGNRSHGAEPAVPARGAGG